MTLYTKQRNAYIKANRNQAVFTTGIKISVYTWDKKSAFGLVTEAPLEWVWHMGRSWVWAAASLAPYGCPRACAELSLPLTGSGELVPPLAHEQQQLGETFRVGPTCCLVSRSRG